MYFKCPPFFHWNNPLPRFNWVAFFDIFFFNSRTPFFSFGFYHKQQATLRIVGHLEDDPFRCVDNPVYRIQDGKCHWEGYAGVFVYSVCSPWCYEGCFIRIPKVVKFVLSRHFTSLWFIIILWIRKHHQNAFLSLIFCLLRDFIPKIQVKSIYEAAPGTLGCLHFSKVLSRTCSRQRTRLFELHNFRKRTYIGITYLTFSLCLRDNLNLGCFLFNCDREWKVLLLSLNKKLNKKVIDIEQNKFRPEFSGISRCCLSSDKMRWSSSFIPHRLSSTNSCIIVANTSLIASVQWKESYINCSFIIIIIIIISFFFL